ncbi:MAG: 1-acyl-sn-glycerol-3-phosphate acyltransferase [Marinilabiliaceae bacterium]|nr:1-acyl-sn-glycerol-3-phosphate acyltransferase [Marinilabiliaceae bacterium]
MPVFSRENIEKRTLSYRITKFFVDILFKLYFPKRVAGLENIDFSDILIFAPNHQNALTDALAILTMRKWQPVFLARSDIFQKPIINKILTFLKIMPIFRIRDGFGTLKQNDAIFRKTIDVLNNRNGLTLMPEGNHDCYRRLRPLKKGIARIAFQAMETSEGKMDIKIVPVGIEYSHYYRFGSPMFLKLGEPFNVSDFYQQYLENNAKGVNQLIKELHNRIKKEMIHIETEEFYYEYETLMLQGAYNSVITNKQRPNSENLFFESKKIVAELDKISETDSEKFMNLMNFATKLKNNLSKVGIKLPINRCQMKGVNLFYKIPTLLATLPIFIYGLLNNMFPFGITAVISSKIKDTQFISSFRFVAAFVLLPLFYIIQTVIFAVVFKNLWWTLFYFVSLPLSSILLQMWRKCFFGTIKELKILKIRLFNNKLYKDLKKDLETIKLL